jgi:hypothetical protein
MTNRQVSALIQLLEESKSAFPSGEERGILAGWIKGMEKRIDQQVKELQQMPGYQQHLQINNLLPKMEQSGLIDLDTLTKLYDSQAKVIS